MKMLSATFIVSLLLASTGSLFAQTPAPPAPILNPNTASQQDLLALPNMTAAIAKTLVDRRPYKTMLEVNAQLSPLLSKEQLSQLYARLFLPIDLNKATRDEILLVPGVGPRMAHEFEEYRPYTSIEQFRKEIGKYVSREEVARLERYVALR